MVEISERGKVYFFYRPRVEEERPRGVEDVQRSYMILRPERDDAFGRSCRGRKLLPDVIDGAQERFWAFVDRVGSSPTEPAMSSGSARWTLRKLPRRSEKHMPVPGTKEHDAKHAELRRELEEIGVSSREAECEGD